MIFTPLITLLSLNFKGLGLLKNPRKLALPEWVRGNSQTSGNILEIKSSNNAEIDSSAASLNCCSS